MKPIQRYKSHLPLLIALVLTAPIIFFQAFRYSFPLGYAGMFTLIAERISAANFQLPMSIPHYGPGGIPLIYPPFAMYVFALAMKLGASTWLYLRFVPALLALFSIVPLYYLTLALLDSKVASVLTAVFVITAPAVYHIHVWSAGVVRAFALLFCLAGLVFYLKALRNFSWRNVFLAGIALGLLVMTHWLYVLFAALVGLAFLLAEWKPSRLLTAFGILVVALGVAAPWLILIVERHGLSNVLLASSSHRNVDFFTSLKDIPAAARFIVENLQYITDNWFLTALAVPGFIRLLVQRKFQLPLAFLFILTMGEASFYTEILAGMMAGAFGAELFRLTPKLDALKNENASGFLKLALSGIVALCALLSVASGLSQISRYQPELDEYSFQTASFVRENTDPDATYLFIGKVNEAEWFPYLFDRTPVFSPWGSEWKGTYAEQTDILVALRECELQKDWGCMEAIRQEQAVLPDLLVIPNKRWLILAVKDAHAWNLLYKGERYLIWERSQ